MPQDNKAPLANRLAAYAHGLALRGPRRRDGRAGEGACHRHDRLRRSPRSTSGRCGSAARWRRPAGGPSTIIGGAERSTPDLATFANTRGDALPRFQRHLTWAASRFIRAITSRPASPSPRPSAPSAARTDRRHRDRLRGELPAGRCARHLDPRLGPAGVRAAVGRARGRPADEACARAARACGQPCAQRSHPDGADPRRRSLRLEGGRGRRDGAQRGVRHAARACGLAARRRSSRASRVLPADQRGRPRSTSRLRRARCAVPHELAASSPTRR